MPRLSKGELAAFIVATLAGSCLHFVHTLLPCPLTALFAPVSESLWEHAKLLYWPTLISGLLLKDRLGARAFSLLLGTALMLVIGYLYHIPLGGESLLFDIILYVLSMAVCLLLPYFLDGEIWQKGQGILVLLALALGVVLMVFTFLPPAGLLFTDLSGADTWYTYPY